jgi:tellurite resistance protein
MTTQTLQLTGFEDARLEAVIETMLLAAHADGEFGPEERTQLARTVSELTGGELAEAKVAALVERIGAGAAADRSARIAAIRGRLGEPATCEAALELAIKVTASDGFIRTSERELIMELAEGLGVDVDKAADMVARVSTR